MVGNISRGCGRIEVQSRGVVQNGGPGHGAHLPDKVILVYTELQTLLWLMLYIDCGLSSKKLGYD